MSGSGNFRGPFRDINSLFLFLLLGYALYLAFLLVEPFLNTLIISAVVCAVAYPIFFWIHVRVRRRSLAALCSTCIIGVLLIIPLFFLTWGLAVQGAHSLAALQTWMLDFKMEDVLGQGYMQSLLDWVRDNLPFVKVEEINIQAKLMVYSEEFAQYLVGFSK
ncbi:MAG: AI-2E family transporter, partial [Proteobacteria bacterium]|nr:AI-2E family transporter [Pseudomonadota bacterium]